MSKKRTEKRMKSILSIGLLLYLSLYIVIPGMMVRAEEQDSSTEIRYEYDELNRIEKVIYPDGTIVTYEYDENGNITKTNIITPDQEKVSTTESTIAEQTTADQTIAEQTTADRTIAEQTTADRTITEQTTADRTIAEQTTADQTIAEQTAADRTATEQSSDAGIPAEITSTENNGSDETTTEDPFIPEMEGDGSRETDRNRDWLPVVIGTAATGLGAAAGIIAYRKIHGEKGADEDEK